MSDPGMEFPKPNDFDDMKPKGPKFSSERFVVLGLVLFGALFLGLAAELWPKDADLQQLFSLSPFMQVAEPTETDEMRQQIMANLQQGDTEQALLLAGKLIEIDPKVGYFERGRIHFLMKKFAEAENDFTKLIEVSPKDADAYKLRAICRLQLDQRDKALEDAAKIAEIEPREGQLLIGEIHEDAKNYDKAVEAYTKLIEIDPAHIAGYLKRYQAYLAKNDFEKALADANKIVDIQPAQGYILKGDALAKLGKSEEAIKSYGDALGHDPTNATALNNRAYHLALMKKDLKDAERDIAEAIEIAGEEGQPAYVDTRGYIAYLQGRFKDALADFNLALDSAEKMKASEEFSAEIFFHRGLVHRKLGEKDLAQKDFDKAKKLGFKWTEEPEPVGGEI